MILVIDANNLCHRHHHTPAGLLTTKGGTPSGVILGTLNSIKGYIEKFPETTKVVVCFDRGKSAWRKELYPDYKAQRDYGKDDPEKAKSYEGLWNQIDVLYEFLPTLGIHSLGVQDNEADDLIAGVCRFLPDEHKIVITSDKDMLQTIDEYTSVYSPYKDRVISPLDFYQETGVTQKAYIGYRALQGDSSDNIFGIPGIGEKTAKNLMNTYGHIDNILGAVGDDKKKLMKSARTKKIFEPQNLAILGRNNKLMNFKYCDYDAIMPTIQEELSRDITCADSKTIRDFLVEWQFASVLANYMSWILPFRALGSED